MTIQSIREDILELRGAEVQIFGQTTTLSAVVAEDTIDILEVLDHLEEKEKSLTVEIYEPSTDEYEEKTFDSIQDLIDYLEAYGSLEEVTHDNTYNWASPLSNNIDFKIYKDSENDTYFVKLMVHRFGDVRANYTDDALLEYDFQDGFIQDLNEITKSVDVEGYTVDINIMRDTYEVYDSNGEFIQDISDIDDFRKEIKEGE